MGKSTVDNIEQRKNKSDSVASSSNSFVKINSIAIELDGTEEVMEPPCLDDQFSIRGYVAGMSKEDIEKCYPFETKIGDRKLEENQMADILQKLEVPRFTWWERMVPGKMVVAAGGDTNAGPSDQNVRREDDGLSLLRDIGNMIDPRKFEDVNNHDRFNAIQNSQTCGTEAQKEIICTKDKRGQGKLYANLSNSNTLESSKNKNSSVNKDKTGHATPCSDVAIVNPFRSCARDDKSPEASDMSLVADPHPSGRVHDVATENVSSESEGTSRQGTAKLRSLNEILVSEGRKQATATRKNKFASSSRVQTTCTERERGVSDPQRQIDVPSNAAKGAKLPPNKRKASHEEDRPNPSTNGPHSSAKRSKGQVLEVERTWRRVENSDSDPSRDADALPNSQLGAKPRSLPPLFRKTPSGQHMGKVPSLSKSKRPVNETIDRPLIPPSKSIMGDCNNKGKAPLDLSLSCSITDGINSVPSSLRQDRDIPDLNLSIAVNTTVTQGKHLPMLSDTGLPPNKNLETSSSSSRAVTDGRGTVSEQQTDNRATEEIPMDIVHYLNENQRQRKLENSRKNYLEESTRAFEESIRASKGRQTEALTGMASFGFPKRSGIGQSIPISFTHPHKTQFGTSNWDDSPFRIVSPFTQSPHSFSQQRKTAYSTSTPLTSRPGPSGMSEALWPFSRPNMPPPFSFPQSHNRPFQASSPGISAFSDSSYKGKTVSDIKGREEKKSVNWSTQNSVGSYNPYPKDTCIPAMQLLSLMDPRIGSGSSVKVGQAKSMQNKALSPGNNHPQVHGNENQSFVKGFYISQNGPSKDLFGLRYGSSYINEKNSALFTRQLPPQQKSSKGILEGPSNLAIRPAVSNLPLGPCTLNKNPADFSIPDAANEYTRISKDKSSRKKNNLRERSRALNLAGQKRQRAN